MKLVTYVKDGQNYAGAVDENDNVFDVSAVGDVLTIMCSASARRKAKSLMNAKDAKAVGKMGRLKLRAPVTPQKILAIGVNYLEHFKEMGRTDLPTKPVVFAKMINALANPGDTVTWYSDATQKMDYEAELAIVMGKKCYRVSEDDALSYVGGYTAANDFSARDIQNGDDAKQWVLGKSFDGACPIGPSIVTSDEIPDPQTLDIQCILNGQVMQHANTSDMLFTCKRLVSHLSHYMTLNPGDVIITGTTHGVGAARKPPVFMKDGDVVIIQLEKIGQLKNKCRVL